MPVLDEVSLSMSSLGEQVGSETGPALYPSAATYPSPGTFPAVEGAVRTPGPVASGLTEGSLTLAPLEEIG